jgi:hypothetical protein
MECNNQDVLYKEKSLLLLFPLLSLELSLHLARQVASTESQARTACAKFLAPPLDIMKMLFIM